MDHDHNTNSSYCDCIGNFLEQLLSARYFHIQFDLWEHFCELC